MTTTVEAHDGREVSPGAPRASRYSMYVVGLLAAANFLSNVDAAVLPTVAASIQAEFGISDTQVGALISAFLVALALASIPVGYLADRWMRRTILGIALTVWSLATLLTGLTRSFPQTLAARAMLGIGEATVMPVGTSIIGDYFSSTTRGRAMGAVFAAVLLGQAGGVIVGGAVGLQFGWRWAFYLAAAPGLLLAPLFFRMREPLRGAAEIHGPKLATARHVSVRALGRLLRIRSFAAAVGAGAFAGFAAGVFQFTALYLSRQFGLDVAQAAALVGIPLLLTGLIGMPLCGWVIDRRGRSSTRAPVEVGVTALCIGALGAVALFSTKSVMVFEVEAILVFSIVAAGGVVAPPVVVQNVVVPSLRGSAAGMQNTFAKLFGFASGPLAVGVFSDLVGHDLGLSLRLLAPAALFVAAACFALALGSMKRDVQTMEENWTRGDLSPIPRSASVPTETKF
jgi:MFS transporter, Spinster family, sphingosine-1-phosphate transporter